MFAVVKNILVLIWSFITRNSVNFVALQIIENIAMSYEFWLGEFFILISS